MKNVLWCIGFISGQTCYLNISQEEAELRFRETNDGQIETIMKVEFEDEFDSYMVNGGTEVDPITPDVVPARTYAPPPPRKPDQDQVLASDTPEF